MLLKSFNIKNFRSILETGDINFSDTLTTIIGKNNQGKSNILKALKIIFDSISYFAERNILVHRSFLQNRFNDDFFEYNWNNDFPIQRQNKKKYKQNTEITIELFLDKDEILQVEKIIQKKIKQKNLRVNLLLGKNDEKQLTFILKGTSKYFADKKIKEQICSLINTKISFQYIQAIRTDELADEMVNKIISLGLLQLDKQSRERLEIALNEITELQKPILKEIEDNLLGTLHDFIPEIANVSLNKQRKDSFIVRRYITGSDFYIKINDGLDTVLAQKGDGIKSLVVLGMMRQSGDKNISEGLILAIEEPESHLHPEAIRQISRVINDISRKNQVILTSHSPLFVNRDNIKDNIIVEKNKAYSPKHMKEIRDVLGVIASDNLINSEFAIVVEGETDKNILQRYFSEKSKKLKDLFESKRLCFEVLRGVFNLSDSLNKLSNMSTKYFCILDSDGIALRHVDNARKKALLNPEKEVSHYNLSNLNECELEDLINPQVYKDYILNEYNIDIFDKKNNDFINGKVKWTTRMINLLNENGKIYTNEKDDEDTKKEKLKARINKIKAEISELIKDYTVNIDNFFTQNKTASIFRMVKQVENYFIHK